MIESQYTSNIHKRLPPTIYKWKVNDNYAGGVPDAFYRNLDGKGEHLWVEYKFIKELPKRGSTIVKPNLSAQQLLWLKQARSSGEQALVIIGCEGLRHNNNPVGVIMRDTREWEQGITADDFRERAWNNDYTAIARHIAVACTCV